MKANRDASSPGPSLLLVAIASALLLVKAPKSVMGQHGDLDCNLEDCSCGDCDVFSERNQWNPSITNPMIIKTNLLVLANNNGTFPTISNTARDAQIAQLNTDFLDFGIQFDVAPVTVNSTCFRHLCDEDYIQHCNPSQLRYDDAYPVQGICCNSYYPQEGCDLEEYQEVHMKEAYAEEDKLNIFVVTHTGGADWAVYPWSSRSTTKSGGVMLMPLSAGGQTCGNGGQHCFALTHEVGHALGLRHTNDIPVQGETSCEEAEACTGDIDCEDCGQLGDMCCDTASADSEYDDGTNYMSYTATGWPDHFTEEQARRMHCWVCTQLPDWIDSPDCNSNSIPDVCEITRGDKDDCDQNGVPDDCQPDCNSNFVADVCDIAEEVSDDCDGNGVPDECHSSTQQRACCHDGDQCTVMTELCCDELSGVFVGEQTTCLYGPCAMFGL